MGSSLSKLADKNFVIGFFIPALLFLAALKGAYGCPKWATTLCPPPSADIFKDLTIFAIFVWVLAVLLVAANYSLYRILEGYHLPAAWSAAFKKRWQGVVQKLVDEEEALRNPNRADGTPKTEDELRAQLQQAGDIRWRRLRQYPESPSQALPTSFGNAIRAFELYPGAMYGASSIALWPVLQTVLPKDVTQRIEDAHAQVDLFVNGCALACAFAAIGLVRAIWLLLWALWVNHVGPIGHAQAFPGVGPDAAAALVFSVAAAAVAWLCYGWAIGRVPAWGATVKSAFDCYLPALAAQMGYALPASDDKRQAFWRGVSAQTVYLRHFKADQYWSGVTAAAKDQSSGTGSTISTGTTAGEADDDDD